MATWLSLVAAIGFVTTAAGPVPVQQSTLQTEDDSAELEGAVVDFERTVVEMRRRVVPFDGQSSIRQGDEITVSLDADVLFDFDSDALTPEAEATLQALAEDLNDNLRGDTVTVVGHTDSKGDDAYNQELSERRAGAVRALLEPLIEAAPSFVVEGRGEAEPVAPNESTDGSDDPDGRRRNRRVEISYQADPPEAPPTG